MCLNILYKFGKTTFVDVLERFDESNHQKLAWNGIPLGRDYNITVLWSMWTTKERAILLESWFKREFPKKFYCEINYNGITECRNWTPDQSNTFLNALEKKCPKGYAYEEEVVKLKQQSGFAQTYQKVYYIMLTKKTITWQIRSSHSTQ